MIRVDEESGLGVALATDANGRYAYLDPYAGAQLALAEAYRNVAVTGATPVAVSDCLNFGSPENPEVMWQFSQAVEGLADACLELGIPVTGGNVSFYNQTGDVPIHPTPVVAVHGSDRRRRAPRPLGLAGLGRQPLPSRQSPTSSSTDRRGRASSTGTWAVGRRRSHLKREKELAELLAAAAHEGLLECGPRPRRRRAGHRARRRLPALRHRRAGLARRAARTRSGGCPDHPVQRVRCAGHRRGSARGGREVPRDSARGAATPSPASASPIAEQTAPAPRSRCRICSPSRSTSCVPPRGRRWPSTSARSSATRPT